MSPLPSPTVNEKRDGDRLGPLGFETPLRRPLLVTQLSRPGTQLWKPLYTNVPGDDPKTGPVPPRRDTDTYWGWNVREKIPEDETQRIPRERKTDSYSDFGTGKRTDSGLGISNSQEDPDLYLSGVVGGTHVYREPYPGPSGRRGSKRGERLWEQGGTV